MTTLDQLDIITVHSNSNPKVGELMELLKGINHECKRTIDKYGIGVTEMKIDNKWHVIYDWFWNYKTSMTYVYYFKEGREQQ